MINVNLIYRFPNPLYFSIENVFKLISDTLKFKVFFEESYAPAGRVSVGGVLKNLLFFRKRTADVFHITGDIHYAALALPPGRVVLTIHDCIFLQHPSVVKRWILKKVWLDWPVNHSIYVTTISEATKKEIVESSGCSPDKILVIPDPLDEKFTFQPLQFNVDKPVLLQVGTWPNKNMERVVRALKGLSCHMLIVGKLSAEQKSLLEENGIEYTNGFQLSKDELIAWYHQSDIVMFATLFEGFGLPILEAQATGRPVITSNISPMKDVAGIGACLVDPLSEKEIREAVLKISFDEDYRSGLIRQGLENIQRYQVNAIADQYLQLYQRVYERLTI